MKNTFTNSSRSCQHPIFEYGLSSLLVMLLFSVPIQGMIPFLPGDESMNIEYLTEQDTPVYFLIHPTCGESNGRISFEFSDHPTESQIDFSLDGGLSYLYSSSDHVGVHVIPNLAPGTFDLWYRWGTTGTGQSLATITLIDQEGPNAQTSIDQTIWIGDTTTIHSYAAGGTNPISYSWMHESDFDQAGIQYAYYQGSFNTLPDFDTLVAVDYGFTDSFDISARLQDQYFAFRFVGKIDIPAVGDYTFKTRSDDGSKLFIGNQLVVDNDGLQAATIASSTINLQAETYDIEVHYFEKTGQEVLEASIEGPGLSEQLIPKSILHTGLSINPSSVVAPQETTTYTVLISDSNGCSDTEEVTVVVDTRPRAESNSNDPTCSANNGSIQLTFSDSPLQSQIEFSLDGGATYPFVFSDDSETGLIENLPPGSYDLWARWGDGTDAIDMPDHQLVDQAGPIASAGNDTTVWVGEAAFLIGASTGGSNPISYSWDHTAGIDQQGVEYAYYQGNFSSLPDFNTLEPEAYGFIDSFHIANALDTDYFAFRFVSTIDLPSDGVYTFKTSSDDGSKLFINGQEVVSNDGLHGTTTKSGTIDLIAGTHSIEVQYFERTGGANLVVKYAGPGISEQVIPNAVLHTVPTILANSTVYPTENQVYTFTVTDGNQCVSTDDVQVFVDTSPRVILSAENPICSESNGRIQFDISDSPLQTSVEFSLNNGVDYIHSFSDQIGVAVLENLPEGNYDIWVRWGDESEPESLGNVSLINQPGPIANAGENQTIWLGESVQLQGTATGGTGNLSYQWMHDGIGEQAGINYKYFEGSWNQLPDFETLSPVSVGSAESFDISSRNQDNYFAFQFLGLIQIDEAGMYTFSTRSDDGSKLYINNNLVVDNDGLHGNQTRSDSVYLIAGKHPIEVTFFEKTGGQNLEVYYEGPNVPYQLIPEAVLSNSGRLDGVSEVSPETTTSYQITVSDENGCASTAEVMIEVIDIPLIATNDTVFLESGQSANLNVLANDFDPLGDPVDGPFQLSNPSGGILFLEVDGSFTYTAQNNFVGIDEFEYEINNEAGNKSATAKVVIIVTADDGQNASPVAIDDAFFVYQFDQLNASLAANDFDSDGDSPLTYQLLTAPSEGTFNLSSNGSFTFDPPSDFSGTLSLEYKVCDPGGACSQALGTITVKPVLVIDVDLFVYLEGVYQSGGSLSNGLNINRGLLPGQIPSDGLVIATVVGNPYRAAPYEYAGSDFEENYGGPYASDVVDWLLITFRSGTNVNSIIKQVTGLLHTDGRITILDSEKLKGSDGNGFYISIDHRNHMGVMSPVKVELTGAKLTYDFRVQDSYKSSTSFGQKEVELGVFAMYAGDADQSNDLSGYDINGLDNVIFSLQNGGFNIYHQADFNLDGDINGADAILWNVNNGLTSSAPKD